MNTLRETLQDAAFAFRVMRKSPLATATIILCLGVSIGATATVVAWMEGLVFRSVRGIPEIERVVSLKTTTQKAQVGLSFPAFREVRDAASSAGARQFEGIGASSIRRFNFGLVSEGGESHAEPVWGLLATANYFDVLRARPILGRGFLPGEDAVAGREPVVVISDALWRRRFAADPGVLGRRVWVNGQELTVVGVAAPEFKGTIAGLAFDIWMPLTMHAAVTGAPELFDDWTIRWLGVFGRLAPGSTLESARATAQVMGTRIASLHPSNRDRGLTATELDVGPTTLLKPLFAIMLSITILVMLIVCTNVANLLMLRGAAREHELAVRLALGAQRMRIIRQLMTESLVLAIAGVVLGLLIAQWAQGSFGALFPDSPLPVTVDTSLDARVILLLTAVGVSTVFIFGLAPALGTTRGAERIKLTGGTRGTTAGGGRVRGALVGAQFALSLAVIVAAGIFLRRLDELERVDRGFRDAQEVVLATVDFELAGNRDGASNPLTIERVVERLRTIPGVRAAAAATFVPLGFLGYSTRDVRIEGYVPAPGESMTFLMNRVSDGYFGTMGIPIVRGRAIAASDRADALEVAVVNESFVRRFWGTGDAVGRVVQFGGRNLTVIGVAADGKYEFNQPLDEPSPPFVYVPFAQWPSGPVVLHVRGGRDPLALLPAIRREVASVDPRLPVLSPTTLESYSSVPLFPIRIGSSVLTMLGGAALVLAALGLYAVIGYAVLQRQREIGVRLALGASPRRVVTGFLIEAARYAGLGAIAGFLLAIALTRMLGHSVPYLMPRDAGGRALPFVVALGALTTVALFAALIPARRATLVSPTTALRAE